jgi:hypothetical protein
MGPLSFSVNYLPDAPVKFGIFDDISALHSEYYTVVPVSESEILRYSNSEIYFSCLQTLHFTDLYSKTLTKYLTKQIPPDDAVKLYGIIEKLGEPDWIYSTDIIRSVLLKWREQIEPDDWKIIVEKRFNDFDKAIKLLTIPDLSLPLFSEFYKILSFNSFKYLKLYCLIFLKLLNEKDRSKLTSYFQRTVERTPPTVLNAIFDNQKELLSLRHIVDNCAGELPISEDVKDLKDALYFSLIDAWVDCKAVILKDDLETLIQKLPKTNEI